MNKEKRKFKKVVKAGKIKKFYQKMWNIIHNNIPKEFRYILGPGQGLPKSVKYKKKNENSI